jgi:hypothetical protein
LSWPAACKRPLAGDWRDLALEHVRRAVANLLLWVEAGELVDDDRRGISSLGSRSLLVARQSLVGGPNYAPGNLAAESAIAARHLDVHVADAKDSGGIANNPYGQNTETSSTDGKLWLGRLGLISKSRPSWGHAASRPAPDRVV